MVAWEPAQAAETVYLANTLLRILGKIKARLTAGPVPAVTPEPAKPAP